MLCHSVLPRKFRLPSLNISDCSLPEMSRNMSDLDFIKASGTRLSNPYKKHGGDK